MPYTVLEGIRVIELATGFAGPYCGKLLAEYGAEVIKLECPETGDPTRWQGPFPDGVPHPEKSAAFLHLNTNKKSITLDIETPQGRQNLKRLLMNSHILIESFPPGKMGSLGLGYDDLKLLRPGLVMVSMTPFGQTGPHRDHEFTELTIFGTGGAMHREGAPNREPLRYGGEIAQYFAGCAAAVAAVAASLRAWRNGLGEWIDISIQECMAGHPNQVGRRAPFVYGGELDPRRQPRSTTDGGNDTYGTGTYKCKDGFVSFLPLGPRMWPSFCRMIGRPDFIDDPRYSTRDGRRLHYDELQAIFQEWLDGRTRTEVFFASQQARVPGGPVLKIDEVKTDPHFRERGFFIDIDHPDAGTLTYTGVPFKMPHVPLESARAAPRLGQHNSESFDYPAVDGVDMQPSTVGDTDHTGPGHSSTPLHDRAPELPLKGLRVLELGEVWAGPYCGTLLADLGAEVIKVESIQRFYRGPIRPPKGAPGYPDGEPGERPWNRFANFNVVNRNKLAITLDLTTPEGVESFKELVSVSDVVFSNYVYGALDSFGLGYQELRGVRPDLIMLVMPGYGGTGPYKRFRSMGVTIDAISGHSSLRGYPDEDLTSLSLVHHPDAVAGETGAFAICAALHYRTRTGKGQLIDMAQAEAFMCHLGEIFLEHGMTGRVRDRYGNAHPAMAPHGCYPCAGEDKWVTIAVRDDGEWMRFCDALGRPELAMSEPYSTLDARLRNQDRLNEIISDWTRTRDRYEVTGLLQGLKIPAGPVLDCGGDTYDDPHLQARDYFETVTHPDAGTHLLSGPIWKLANTPRQPQTHGPTLGEHNNYVLGDVLGTSGARLQELARRNVIGTTPLEGADMGGVRRVARGT